MCNPHPPYHRGLYMKIDRAKTGERRNIVHGAAEALFSSILNRRSKFSCRLIQLRLSKAQGIMNNLSKVPNHSNTRIGDQKYAIT